MTNPNDKTSQAQNLGKRSEQQLRYFVWRLLEIDHDPKLQLDDEAVPYAMANEFAKLVRFADYPENKVKDT